MSRLLNSADPRSGWYDPLIQFKSYLDFATDAPGYGQLQNDSVLQEMRNDWYRSGGCKDQLDACSAAGDSSRSVHICKNADSYCVRPEYSGLYKRVMILVWQTNTMGNLAFGNRDDNDLRQNSSGLFPPEYYLKYLANTTIMRKIGAASMYEECADPPHQLFENTGDVSLFDRCAMYM